MTFVSYRLTDIRTDRHTYIQTRPKLLYYFASRVVRNNHIEFYKRLNGDIQYNQKLENVAIANALQPEAARRRAVPIRFNTSPVPSLKSLRLSVAVLERIYCRYVTLRCDLEL